MSGQEFACKVVKLGRVKDVAKREMLMREIAIIKVRGVCAPICRACLPAIHIFSKNGLIVHLHLLHTFV